MSFLRRRAQPDLFLPQSIDSMQALKDQEDKDAWRAKPRSEKLRLARAEKRRRKQQQQRNPFSLQFWTIGRICLVIMGLSILALLVILLSQHQGQRLKGFRHHGGSWAARVESIVGDAIGL